MLTNKLKTKKIIKKYLFYLGINFEIIIVDVLSAH